MSRFYFSFTYDDLTKHRQAVMQAIRDHNKNWEEDWHQIECIDSNTIPPSKSSSIDTRLTEVKESSYFILILGWEYGEVIEEHGKSVVELEWEAAIENNLVRFCFFIDDSYPMASSRANIGKNAERLKRFKDKIEKEHMALRFTTPFDLESKIKRAFETLTQTMSKSMQSLFENSVLKREYQRYKYEASILRESVEFYENKLSRIVPADPIWRGRNFNTDPNLCFALMPFEEPFFVVYEEAIITTVNSFDLRALHANEIFGNREIMEDIWSSIARSRILIADVTGRNANVFYELGIAHTLGKDCVVITQNEKDVPFDINSRRYIKYNPKKLASLRESLKKTIAKILK